MASHDAIQNQIAKIAASRAFEGSARLRELLRYTVSKALAGHGDQLKESVLGVEVFGRTPGYDSDANSIVRVEFAACVRNWKSITVRKAKMMLSGSPTHAAVTIPSSRAKTHPRRLKAASRCCH